MLAFVILEIMESEEPPNIPRDVKNRGKDRYGLNVQYITIRIRFTINV